MSYIVASRHRIFPFLVVGEAPSLSTGASLSLFRVAGLSTPLLVNLALILSIEISILYNFVFQYLWTWKDSERLRGGLSSSSASPFTGPSGGRRRPPHPLSHRQVFDLQDDLNFVIGVAVATVLDFALYDKVVFHQRLTSLRQEAPGDRATLTP